MRGDTRQTTYFGLYEERKDTDNLPIEITGNVVKVQYKDTDAAYLFSDAKGNRRYDLPRFMLDYQNKHVAVLGRVYSKTVENKIYYKLVVIAVRELRE